MQEKYDPISSDDVASKKRFEALSLSEQKMEINKSHQEAEYLNGRSLTLIAEIETDAEFKKDLLLAIDVSKAVKSRGGLALVVGGFARDEALNRFGYNIKSKDIDLEVYGLEFSELESILKEYGETNIVGASFGVIKLKGLDISIPRRDSKAGKGHRGFNVEGDPHMTVKEAARRRDFTINALAFDPLTGEILDEFEGLKDIQNRILRATDPSAFVEDPLRVLRAMQFIGRFEFSIVPDTLELCKNLDLSDLAKERIGEEWVKLLTRSAKPSIGMEAARELGVLEKLHPELNALIGVPQEKEWHPEGDVWIHTKMVVDAAVEIAQRENLEDKDYLLLVLAALCHDLGKPSTTKKRESDGRIISHAHSEAGLKPAQTFLDSLKIPADLIKKILPLVREHLWPSQNKKPSDAAVRRLATRLHPASVKELVMVGEADHKGRDLAWSGYPEGQSLLKIAENLEVVQNKPQALVMGRDLIGLGFKAGPKIGQILRQLFEAQLEGLFFTREGGVKYYKQNIEERG